MNILRRLVRPHLPLEDLELMLRGERPLRLRAAKGCRLRCTQGCAWVTAPGEARDIYLFAGDAWEVRCDGLVLVEPATCALASVRIERTVPRLLRTAQ
jgi:hypothetical protein